jgi:hypothetical protein
MVKTMTSLLAFRLDEQQIVVIVALFFFEFQTCCASCGEAKAGKPLGWDESKLSSLKKINALRTKRMFQS